jgi:hypothetical protein
MVGQLHRHSPRGLPGVVDRVPQCLSRPLHSSRCDKEEAPGIHGPKARWKVRARLLKAVQPPDAVCAGPSGHGREEEEPLHDRSLHQAIEAHHAQHGRDIYQVCQQCHRRRRCDPRPQGNQEEEGCDSSVRKCSPEVLDGVPPRLHLPTSLDAAASTPATAAVVGSPPTLAPTPAGSTQGSTSTSACAALANATDRWSRL